MKTWLALLFNLLLIQAAHSAILMQPYLQAVTTNSVYVLVECNTNDTVKVAFGLTTLLSDTSKTLIISTTSSPTYVHKIKLTGLLTNTVYYYKAIQGSSVSALYSFHTAVNPGTSFRMSWMADCRTQTAIHDQIASQIATYNPLFSLYGGDYCATSSYTSWKNEFFLANELNLDSYVPFFPAIGNHETWGQNAKAFTRNPESSSGTQDYYSFDYGDVHFLCINNQVSYASGSPQYIFAQSDLQASTKTWKIVFNHNPAYCSGGHGEDAGMIAMSQNIFVPNNVDMVISGHSHFYQHNYVDGVHHLVIGDAGAPQAKPDYAPYTVLSVQDYEFGIIDVTPTSFTLKIYTNLNQKFDSVKLIKPAPMSGPVSGTKTIGPQPSNFVSLTQAIDYLRTEGNGVNGALCLELKTGYSSSIETFPLTINSIPGTSATNTITIRPADGASALLVTSNNPDGTLILNNTKYLRIDGRPGGTGNSQLTFENQNTTGNAVRFIHDASDNVIRYCTLKGVNSTTTSGTAPGGLFFGTTSLTTGNDNNLIEHCMLRNGNTLPEYLVYSKGTSGKDNSSNTFSDNEFCNFKSSAIYLSSTGNGNNWLISGNSFYYNFVSPPSASQVVIRFGSSTATGNLITGNFVGGQSAMCGGSQWIINGTLSFTGIWVASADVTKNRISNIGSSQSSSTPVIYGLYNAGAAGITNEFSNNMVALDGGASQNPILYGYYENAPAGAVCNLFYNSLQIFGPATGSSSTCVFYRNSSISHTLRNNIFSNKRTTGGTGKHYSIYCSATGGLNSDYNNLYSLAGPLGYYNSASRVTLSDWQAATNGDAHSISFSPAFLSSTDLHIAWDPNLDNKGIFLTSPSTDFDENIRENPPDPGINEFSLTRTWTGVASTNWNDGANWSPVGVPVPVQNVLIPAGAPNYPILVPGGLTCNDLTLTTGAIFFIPTGCILNLNGNLTIGNGAVYTNQGTVNVQGNIYFN